MAMLPARRSGQMHDRQQVASGEIKETENGRRHRSSRRADRFEYWTYLPRDVKADQVSAKLSYGVFMVTVPKFEAAKPRRIEVQASGAKN
jgi:HSP20 family protein